MRKLICLVGMAGSGKSVVAERLVKNKKFGFVRFGQVVLDEVIKEGGEPTEKREREIREGFRKKLGMAAIALLNMPKFDKAFKSGDVIGDGLYSWEEYLVLKEKYKESLIVIAVYASPAIRYSRLSGRSQRHFGDKQLRFRSFSKKEAVARDIVEIENLHKAGPIVMADYTIVNEGTVSKLNAKVDEIFKKIYDGDKLLKGKN